MLEVQLPQGHQRKSCHIEAIEAVKLIPPHHLEENTSLGCTHTHTHWQGNPGLHWLERVENLEQKHKKETESGVINIKIIYPAHKILLSNQFQEIETYFPPN